MRQEQSMATGRRMGWAGLLAATALVVANPALGQGAANSAVRESTQDAAMAQAMDRAMTPGAGQKRLEPMIGTFSVRMRTWVSATSAAIESQGTSVNAWVLGGRYVQSMLSGHVLGEPFNGIGYMAYDNVAKAYQVAWMDDGSTAMTLYQGRFSADGKQVHLKATVLNPVTGKPAPAEIRMSLAANGDHVTELWGQGLGGKMFRMMELQHTRTKQ
jgi:hypothetical protein